MLLGKATTWDNYSYSICCFLSKETHLLSQESCYFCYYFMLLFYFMARRCHNYLAQDSSDLNYLGSFGVCLKILYSINVQRFGPSILEHIRIINRMDFLAVISPLCIIINNVPDIMVELFEQKFQDLNIGTKDNKHIRTPSIIT